MRPNFHVNISEQFTIREYLRYFFEGSIHMDLLEDVDEDDYLRKEISCSKTTYPLSLKQSKLVKMIVHIFGRLSK